MLISLNKAYFIISGLLYYYFMFSTSTHFLPLYFLHVLTFIAYAFILTEVFNRKDSYYSNQNLLLLVSTFSFLFVIIYNYISYAYNNNFFVFSEADASTYYRHALNMASMTLKDSITYYLSFGYIDDLGAVLVSSTLYRLIESILFLNCFYILAGLITAFCIFRISRHFMSLKYAFLCSIAYSLSSFVLWFHSSGLKESFMCMLIVLFFDRYYLYMKKKALIHLAYVSLFLAALLLFRPPLTFFCIGAVAMSLILKKRKGATGGMMILFAFVSFIVLYPVFQSSYDSFLLGGDLKRLLVAKEADGMIKGSLQFTYAVNLLAQLIGPLPTISPDTKALLSFFSVGLIYKALLSILFWPGVYYILKQKVEMLYPLIFFAFFEMISLLLILEGLELRKSLPHFFIIYVVAFWFIDQYESTNNFKNLKIRRRMNSLFSLSSVVVFFLILIWNIRNQVS